LFTMTALPEPANVLVMENPAAQDLRHFPGDDRFGCVMADPPPRFPQPHLTAAAWVLVAHIRVATRYLAIT